MSLFVRPVFENSNQWMKFCLPKGFFSMSQNSRSSLHRHPRSSWSPRRPGSTARGWWSGSCRTPGCRSPSSCGYQTTFGCVRSRLPAKQFFLVSVKKTPRQFFTASSCKWCLNQLNAKKRQLYKLPHSSLCSSSNQVHLLFLSFHFHPYYGTFLCLLLPYLKGLYKGLLCCGAFSCCAHAAKAEI